MVQLIDPKKIGLPLKNKRIVITRAQEQNLSLIEQIQSLGGTAIELPLIKITPFCDPDTLDDVFNELGSYDWLIFTSTNGVQNFFNFFFQRFKDIRCIGGLRIACIGQSTATEVEKRHLQVDIIPQKSTSEDLAQAIMEAENLDSLKVLIVTGNLNKNTLPKMLEEEGRAIVDTCPVYKTQQNDITNNPEAQDFTKKGADAIIFTSPSTVQSFAEQAKHLQLKKTAKHPIPYSIGPSTTEALKKLGMAHYIEANNQSTEGLIDALIQNT